MNYSDLVQFWDEGRKKWRDYEFEVGKIAASIHKYFLDKLEINTEEKREYLLLIPLKEKDNEKLRTTWYAPYVCVEFLDKGWANVGLLLLLEKDKRAWPKKQFLFTLSIKKQKDNWLLKIADDGTEHSVKIDLQQADLEPLWNEFTGLLKFQTIDQLENWLKLK